MIAKFREFTTPPAGADLVGEVRRHGCEEPDSGASPPSITRTYRIAPEELDSAASVLRTEWEQQGWLRDTSSNLPAYFAYRKVTSAGWTAGLNMYAPSGTTIDVEGEVEDALPTC